MEELLPLLKRPVRPTATNITDQNDIFFRLCFDGKGAFVDVIDKKKRKIQVDYHAYSGDVFNVLRSLAIISEKRKMQFTWDGQTSPIYLGDHTGLLHQLLKCNNVLNELGKVIRVSSSVAVPGLAVMPEGEKMSSSFFLTTEEGETDQFQFLSDSFVLASQVIYPVKPIGLNYAQLPVFKSTFSRKFLETYLSVFFSYFDNMDLRYKDYTLERSDSEIKTVPKLIIEKIDPDKTIFMHLERCLPNVELPGADRFDLTWLAMLTEDRKIMLKRIIHEPLDSVAANLKMTIQDLAPNKEGKKDVYRNGNFFIIQPETAKLFLSNKLPSLQDEFILAGIDHLNDHKDN